MSADYVTDVDARLDRGARWRGEADAWAVESAAATLADAYGTVARPGTIRPPLGAVR